MTKKPIKITNKYPGILKSTGINNQKEPYVINQEQKTRNNPIKTNLYIKNKPNFNQPATRDERQATKNMQNKPNFRQVEAKRSIKKHPAVTIRNEAFEIFSKLAKRFGITP